MKSSRGVYDGPLGKSSLLISMISCARHCPAWSGNSCRPRSAASGSGEALPLRPSVRCGLKGRFSRSMPARSAAMSTFFWRVRSLSRSPARPAQITRGRAMSGKPPAPSMLRLRPPSGFNPAKFLPREATVSSCRSPQNLSVICMRGAATQRTSEDSRRRAFIHLSSISLFSSGMGIQTKMRRSLPASGGIQEPISSASPA